jgi:hypothetical protein
MFGMRAAEFVERPAGFAATLVTFAIVSTDEISRNIRNHRIDAGFFYRWDRRLKKGLIDPVGTA